MSNEEKIWKCKTDSDTCWNVIAYNDETLEELLNKYAVHIRAHLPIWLQQEVEHNKRLYESYKRNGIEEYAAIYNNIHPTHITITCGLVLETEKERINPSCSSWIQPEWWSCDRECYIDLTDQQLQQQDYYEILERLLAQASKERERIQKKNPQYIHSSVPYFDIDIEDYSSKELQQKKGWHYGR